MPRRGLLLATVATLALGGAAGTAASASSVGPAKIATGVLAPTDLSGAKATDQGYVSDSAAVSAYEREFQNVAYGSSRLLYLESRLMLYRSPLDATLARTATWAVVNPAGRSFTTYLRSAVAHFAGVSLTSFSVRSDTELALPATDGRAIVLRIVTPLGRVDEGYVFMQTGKLLGTLTVMSTPGTPIEPADLTRLYRTFAGHMRATGAA
jgi:hypothetical protein